VLTIGPGPDIKEGDSCYKVGSKSCYTYLSAFVVNGRKGREAGEDCIMRSFVTCMLWQILR
jgi:hypothetical protein